MTKTTQTDISKDQTLLDLVGGPDALIEPLVEKLFVHFLESDRGIQVENAITEAIDSEVKQIIDNQMPKAIDAEYDLMDTWDNKTGVTTIRKQIIERINLGVKHRFDGYTNWRRDVEQAIETEVAAKVKKEVDAATSHITQALTLELEKPLLATLEKAAKNARETIAKGKSK